MKHLKHLLIIISFISLLSSCETNEIGDTDCITCQTTQIEYCYTEGYNYYIITEFDGTEITGELTGSWSDTKQILLAQCENSDPTTDCYTCSDTNTQYCYTFGDDYYTITVDGETPTQENLNGESWANLKSSFVTDCDDDNGGETNGNIVGTWNATNYWGTSTTETSANGTTITTNDTFQSTSIDNYISVFSENPNEVYASGSIEVHHVLVANGITQESDTTSTANANDISSWELNGTNLILTPIPDNVDEIIVTVLELTDNSLKYRVNTTVSVEVNGTTSTSTQEIFMNFTR